MFYQIYLKNISQDLVQKLKTFPILRYGSIRGGLIIERKIKRDYPLGKIAERTIGYERIDEKGNYRGVGLEHAFGPYLRGKNGQMIKRKISNEYDDNLNYQTVFAKKEGAVAAPTAGLHFTNDILDEIKEKGISIGELTLHVGAGTFAPLRDEQIESKKLHEEYFEVDQKLCEQIKAAKANDGRIIAVGTTVVRALESLMQKNGIEPINDKTDIFITPGFNFELVDAMITNFHLPESSLIMLVSAFAGRETILKSYQHAVDNGYRFYSYGDSMFIDRG